MIRTTPHLRQRLDQRGLRLEWVERVIANPKEIRQQLDGRWRYYGFIQELGKYLRVVLLEDHETVHSAFPDRNYTRRQR